MTLLETALTAALVGILAHAAVSAVGTAADRARVVQAQAAVLAAFRTAQASARALGRPVELLLAADSIVVRSRVGGDSLILERRPGPAAAGVAVAPTLHVATYGPNGLSTGAANQTVRLARGAVSRSVVVSRLGRARAP